MTVCRTKLASQPGSKIKSHQAPNVNKSWLYKYIKKEIVASWLIAIIIIVVLIIYIYTTQLEMKKESLISARDKLKERATSLWNRLSCPEPEGEAFREAAMSTLSDDIRRVRAFACNPQDVLSGILTLLIVY